MVPAGTIPFVIFTGVTVKVPPLQRVGVKLEIAGVGFTVITTLLVAPAQPAGLTGVTT